MHYHSSRIDTLNVSVENRGKRTKKASIPQNFVIFILLALFDAITLRVYKEITSTNTRKPRTRLKHHCLRSIPD